MIVDYAKFSDVFQTKLYETCWFQLLKCKELLFNLVICNSEFRVLGVFELFEDVTSGSGNLWLEVFLKLFDIPRLKNQFRLKIREENNLQINQ